MGLFETKVDELNVKQKAWSILGDETADDFRRVCLKYGENPDEVRLYDVYKFSYHNQQMVLKMSSDGEAACYAQYLHGKNLPAPKFYGSLQDGDENWFVTECVEGDDLNIMTDQLALAAAETVAQVQNTYWGSADTPRMDVYRQKINRRYDHMKDEPLVGEAYRLFVERQKDIPRTLCQGDFLQINAINRNGQVVMIDWGSGGILPYALDIARFIAHGTEKREVFPITMNNQQKELFVRRVYELLENKPDYQRYLLDIRLAVLNEYVEFVVADEDADGWYLRHAKALAEEILNIFSAKEGM